MIAVDDRVLRSWEDEGEISDVRIVPASWEVR